MNLTIKAPSFTTIVAPTTEGLYDLTHIARELRLDFPESKMQKPNDWLEANYSGIEQAKQVCVKGERILGTLMALYVYIDWVNTQATCVTQLIKVFPDCELKTKKRSIRESLEFVEATLEDVLDTVCGATFKSFECDSPKHDVNEHIEVYDNSVHLKSMVRHMLAILHDSVATACIFDQFHSDN